MMPNRSPLRGPIVAESSRLSPSYMPWWYPPPGFRAFNPAQALALPAIGITSAVVTLPVPLGYDGVILRLSHRCTAMFVDGDLIWRLQADGRPIPNYGNLSVEFGPPNNPVATDGILIYSGQTINYMLNNVALAGAGVMIVCSLGGYFWPKGVESW